MIKPFKSVPGFFNRTLETRNLIMRLLGEPKFHVVTGGNDTGKTALIKHATNVFEEATNKKINVIELNFRKHPCFNRDNLFDAFKSVIESSGFFNELSKYSLKSIDIANLKIEWEKVNKIEDPLRGFMNTLMMIEKRVPSYSPANNQVNLLYIDEANELQSLSNSEDEKDREAYQFLLKWIIRNTKETPRINVIFGTNDSFYLHSLLNSVSKDLIKTITIGDLSQKDSIDYYNYLIDSDPNYSTHKDILKDLNFLEDIYPYIGGRIYYIKDAVSEHLLELSRPKGENLALYRRSFNYCEFALIASKTSKSPVFKYQPNWTRETALKAFNKISREGYIKHEEIEKNNLGEEYMSLVKNNVLNYRETPPIEEDIEGLKGKIIEYPVLIAPSRMMHRSMEMLSNI